MAAPHYRLIIGNKAWSSWSLRPWLVMRRFGLPFEEINIRLREAASKEQILNHSAAGKVPALYIDSLLVWDSLAIIETLADRHPEHSIWPKDADARALARSVSAEMHSGFQSLRENCPMDLLKQEPKADLPEAAQTNVRRVVAIWRECRSRYGGSGPFLFSGFSAADAMYAPVASRFRTYVDNLAAYGDDGTAAEYVDAIFSMPEMAEWVAGAKREQAA